MSYKLVCGLETQIELATKTKIFCSCTTQFGGEPNTHCCPVCTGQPGALPVLNREVINYAVRAGLAVHCKINNNSHMDRKNYVYPDLPKAYQISQFDEPVCVDGYVELDSGPCPTDDPDLNCGGWSVPESIIHLAHSVRFHYGTDGRNRFTYLDI